MDMTELYGHDREADSLSQNGFSAESFVDVIENSRVWGTIIEIA